MVLPILGFMNTERPATGAVQRGVLFLAMMLMALTTNLVTTTQAAATTSDAPVREIDLGTDWMTGLATSAHDDRVVVTGAGRLEIHTLSSLDLIATHSFGGSLGHPKIAHGNVYVVLADLQELAEIRLSDGVVLNRWNIGPYSVRPLYVSPSYVWFYRFQSVGSDAQAVCRLDPVDGALECFQEVESDPFYSVRGIAFVDPSEESFVLDTHSFPNGGEIGDWFVRYNVVGSQAVKDTSGPRSPNGYELEVAPEDEYTLWHASSFWLANVDPSTLEPSSITYQEYGSHMLAVEPEQGELVAMAGVGADVKIFRRGSVFAVATIEPGEDQVRSAHGGALTQTEFVRVEQMGVRYFLRVYPILADSEPAPVGSGVTYSEAGGIVGVRGLGIHTVNSLEIDEDSNRLVVAGANVLGIYELTTMRQIAMIPQSTEFYINAEVTIEGGSVFVLDSFLGEVLEYRLQDGHLLNDWTLPVRGSQGVAVSPDYIWFSAPDLVSPTIGRLDRATGRSDFVALPSESVRVDQISVNPVNQNELLIGLPWLSALVTVDGDVVTSYQSLGSTKIGFGWGSNGDMIYTATADQVTATNGSAEQYVIGRLQTQRTAYMATDRSGDSLAIVNSQGAIGVYEPGSSEPAWSVESWLSPHQLAVSQNYVGVVGGNDSGMTIAVWPQGIAQADNVIEFISIVHGETTLTTAEVTLWCANEELISIDIGTTRRVSVPHSERACVLGIPRHSYRQAMLWSGTEWVEIEDFAIRIDMLAQPRVLLAYHFASPVTSFAKFAAQTYRDITGSPGSGAEVTEAANLLGRGQITKYEFVRSLMSREAGYESVQAPVSRLYRAYFLRNADMAGHQYWIEQRLGGRSLYSVSDFFADSPEFKTRYGSVGDAEFVRLVYQNVMTRLPDAKGEAYWLDRLSKGLSRGELMTLFSDSPEFRTRADADVFVTYIAGALEQRELTASEHSIYVGIYANGGAQAVVNSILEGDVYYDRFWSAR